MDRREVDVWQTRKFDRKRYLWKQMPLALGVFALGMAMVLIADQSSRSGRQSLLAGGILVSAGLVFAGYVMYREAHPEKPMLELSPAGIAYRITPQKEVNIPWREIHSVESIDIIGPRKVVFPKVTVASVSREFYDRHIHIASQFSRGPYWGAYIIEEGAKVKVALHHEFASVSATEMRKEIETRWRAFKGGSAGLTATSL